MRDPSPAYSGDALSEEREVQVVLPVVKKRGVRRNHNIRQIRKSPELINRRALSVLCASIVSTDGILSAPLQLGAKIILSRAAVLCPGGVESW